MDGYNIDGFDVMNQIMTANPYAKIIIISAYMKDYTLRVSEYISKGAILALSLYLGSGEIAKLIHTPNMLDEFKEIIDRQVA